ncbi:PREDICTED: uncharacterized protein LOC108555798 [Eufriesea mexicana]|uniref:uncharacterized protein LOC108555798 n=1 Tax=Eufriesea mexicana TaxID=516756 RepID=UPI00083BD83E|nr:PREDICTED: uncharacterized protein LOC108555798 [Eufriesea mexicana]
MKTIKDELFKWVCKKYAMNSSFDKHSLREEALRLMKIRGTNGVKCTDRWLNNILKEYGLRSTNSTSQPGPMFKDYREWIELMRSTIIAYRYKDLFHVDELTMYSDGFPSRILSNKGSEKSESPKNRITILMSCNSSGTMKLPLLICGPYPCNATVKDHVYCQSKDSHIGDKLFRNWLLSVNDRMTKCNRKILLFLRQNRARALKDFVPSNIQLLYFPEDFPPLLRPLRRDVFHYIKMVFRRRYTERLKQCTVDWNLHDILTSLIEAWETTPRELVIFSFQRTHFRTDDCFLQIHCDFWDSLKADISFKSFVTFDDDLSDEQVPRKRNNGYNDYKHSDLGSRNVIQINEDTLDSVLEDPKNIEGTTVREESCESVRNCRKTDLKVRNRTHRKHPVVTSHEKTWNDNARRCRLKENLTGVRGKQRKSQKRTYSETQFSEMKGQNDNRCTSGQRNVKKTFVPEDFDVNVQTFENISISERHRSEMNEIRECLRTTIDKALTTSSTSLANCTKNLLDSTHAAKHEITKNTGNLIQFELLNERGDTKSKCTIRETMQIECTDKIITNLPNCFLNKFNQPSTSTNNCSILPKGIVQGVPKETIENHPFEISSSNSFELHEQNLDNSQNLNQIINLNNGNSLPSAYWEIMNFSKQKRQKSLDDPKDNSQTSETRENILKPNNDWSKQFETTFVFGSPDTNCSSDIQHDESNIESRIFNVRSSISPKD